MRNVIRDRRHKKDTLHTFCVICLENYEKHASRVSQVIAAVAKVSCKHGLWLVARVNYKKIESHLESGFYLFVLEREKMNSVPTPSVLMTLIFSLWA